MEADDIIRHFDLLRPARPVVTQLAHEEDGEPYRVWKLDCGGAVYLLKEAKEYEAEVYRAILPKVGGSVPALPPTSTARHTCSWSSWRAPTCADAAGAG